MARAHDKAKWHYEADDFPSELPEHRGATHIGYFVRWCIENDLASPELRAQHGRAVSRLVAGKLAPGRFVLEQLGGSFTDEELTVAGQAFAKGAYDDYLGAFERTMRRIAKPTYMVPVSEENYTKVSAILNRLFRAWQKERATSTRKPKTSASRSRTKSPKR